MSRKWGKRSYLKPPYCRCQDAAFPPLESGTYYIFRTNRGRRGRLWFSILQSVCYMESTLWTALGKRRFLVKQNTHLCNQTSCVTYVPQNALRHKQFRICKRENQIFKNYFFLGFIKELLIIPLQKSANQSHKIMFKATSELKSHFFFNCNPNNNYK